MNKSAVLDTAGLPSVCPPRQRIPKRIIHIYCTPSGGAPAPMPLLYRAAIANATLLNHDFEHILLDNKAMAAFLEKEPIAHRRAMEAFRFPIQRFDFLRYLAIYRLGGTYMDLDVILARSLDPLLEWGCVFPFEELTLSAHLRQCCGLDWELGNYAFAAEPGNPFLAAIIENCIRALENPAWVEPMMRGIPRMFRKDFYVVNTTGPGLVSRTFCEHPELRKDIAVLLPDDVCDERASHRFGDYGVHLMNASWRRRGSYIYRRLARLWEVRRRRRLLSESAGFGPSRSGDWKTIRCATC